jgi:hypothetical protein
MMTADGACPMKEQAPEIGIPRLLIPLDGLANRFGVQQISLLRLDERLHVLRRNQP